jgi:hypothetical protein
VGRDNTIFTGINFKLRKTFENAQTPTSRVHAVLGNLPAYQIAGFLHGMNPRDQMCAKHMTWKRTKPSNAFLSSVHIFVVSKAIALKP